MNKGRFTSQALLDEAALLTAMAYVDLNPIQARIQAWAEEQEASTEPQEPVGKPALLSFQGATGNDRDIPFTFHDYLELVDWTGRAIRPDKRGAVSSQQPPILARLGINARQFARHMKPRPPIGFHRVIGKLSQIKHAAEQFGMRFFKGQAYAAKLFGLPR